MQWINREIGARWPSKISIAEDLQDNSALTRNADAGGAGFGAQWAANFVHPVRRALITGWDEGRSMGQLRDAILGAYDGDAFKRVVYTESHDEIANGRARLPQDIAPQAPGNWFARKRSILGAVLVFTAPGGGPVDDGDFRNRIWYPHMEPNHALLLKTYDSSTDGRCRFMGHSAFEDPNTPPDAPKRESIEVRTMAFF